MASAKRESQVATKPKAADIDMKAFMPEGMSEDDLSVVGGLRPICQPEEMMGAPVGGWIIGILDMPPRKDKSEWRALLVETTGACRAKVGEEVQTIDAGEEVLIPLNGNLKNNPDLLNAAASDTHVFWGFLQCVGQVELGKPSPMWDFDVKLNKKSPKPRTGKYLLHQSIARVEVIPQLGKDDITRANGQPAGSMVG